MKRNIDRHGSVPEPDDISNRNPARLVMARPPEGILPSPKPCAPLRHATHPPRWTAPNPPARLTARKVRRTANHGQHHRQPIDQPVPPCSFPGGPYGGADRCAHRALLAPPSAASIDRRDATFANLRPHASQPAAYNLRTHPKTQATPCPATSHSLRFTPPVAQPLLHRTGADFAPNRPTARRSIAAYA